MKRLIPLLLLLLAASVSAQVLDVPVAVVRITETANIGRRELTEQITLFSQQLGRELTADEQEQILDALINDLLLIQGATRAAVLGTLIARPAPLTSRTVATDRRTP